jgi:hypothetical protein
MPKSTHSWSDVKPSIVKLPLPGLISLIQELYNLNPNVKDFINVRFTTGDAVLSQYKSNLRKYLTPKGGWNTDAISVAKAKNVVATYKKAKGDALGLAELCVTYVEIACETLDAHGMAHYDAFYNAFDIMIARACALIIELPVEYQVPLVLRLHEAQPQFIDTNLEEQFAKYGFDQW